jgi:DNA-binding NarL/FixJ family response regulator
MEMPVSQDSAHGRVNALVVDDQPSTLLLMHAMLERAGYNMVECATGQSAIDALLARQYDLLILDLNLPDMSGLDLLRSPRLKKLPPVLGITASLTPELVEQAELAGMSRILQKPISCEQLIESAAAAIKAARSIELSVCSGPAIDPIRLSEVRAISDERMFHRFVNQALADAWHCLEELENAASSDPALWRQHAKTLDGVVRSIGARRLESAISDALLKPAKQLQDAAGPLTKQLIDLLDEAQESLREWLSHGRSDIIGQLAVRENTSHVSLELTERERDVLRWTAAGKTSSETGMILGISARTVNYHITSILLKLNAVNKTQAVVKAVMLDLLN